MFVQPDVCNGCGYCVFSCPFGVVDKNQEVGTAFKCTFCYDRQRQGLMPACAKACPTQSIKFGELGELRRREPADFRPLKSRPYIVPIIYRWQETTPFVIAPKRKLT